MATFRAACAFVLLFLIGCAAPKAEKTAALPDLPKVATEKFLPRVRQEVDKAYQAAQANPNDAPANGRLGMILHAHGQFESAAVCYRRAAALDPSSSFNWLYSLALAQSAVGRNDEAAFTLHDALLRKPEDVPARLKRAEDLLASGKRQEAESTWRSVLKDQPDSAAAAVAWYGLGRLSQSTRPGDAAEALKKAIELFPPYGSAHYALGLVCRTLGDSAESRRHLDLSEQYKNAVPPVPDPLAREIADLATGGTQHIRVANDLANAGKLKDAAEETEKALEVAPQLVQAHINLISLYGRMDQPERAAEHYREAIGLDPNAAEAYYNFGVLEFSRKKFKEAQAAFVKSLEINPFFADAHNNLGYLLEQQGHPDAALGHYRKAVANNPSYRLAHFHLGRVLADRRQYPEAVEHLLKTLQPEDDDTPGYMYGLATAYARSGDSTNGLRYAREARDRAVAKGQNALAAAIERDIQRMEGSGK